MCIVLEYPNKTYGQKQEEDCLIVRARKHSIKGKLQYNKEKYHSEVEGGGVEVVFPN